MASQVVEGHASLQELCQRSTFSDVNVYSDEHIAAHALRFPLKITAVNGINNTRFASVMTKDILQHLEGPEIVG